MTRVLLSHHGEADCFRGAVSIDYLRSLVFCLDQYLQDLGGLEQHFLEEERRLTEEIKEDYVLLFQEDMWLNKKVNPRFFEQLFDLAQLNKWKIIKKHFYTGHKQGCI